MLQNNILYPQPAHIIYIYIYIYTRTPPYKENTTQGLLFKQFLTGLTFELSFSPNGCRSEVNEPVCPTLYQELEGK